MKKTFTIYFVPVCLLFMAGCRTSQQMNLAGRDRLFNDDWKFVRDSLVGAEQPGYDDSQWLNIDLLGETQCNQKY